jgi:DNA polymerase-3 subunit alpha
MSRAATTGGSGGAALNKGTVEALIKCGAMDALHGRENRAAMVASVESAMSAAQKVAADKAAGQGGLFLGGGPAKAESKATAPSGLVKVAAWTEGETLQQEKEALGFYVSSHPLTRWKQWASVFATFTTETARAAAHDQRAVVAGLVQGIRTIIVKNGRSAGQKMAIVVVEDEVGTIETVMFADCYSQFGHLLQQDAVVFMLGRVDRSRAGMVIGKKGAAAAGGDDEEGGPAGGGSNGNENVQIVIDRVVPIDGVPLMPGRMWLRVDTDRLNGSGESALRAVAEVLRNGEAAATTAIVEVKANAEKAQKFPVDIVVDTPDARVRLEVPSTTRVQPTPPLIGELTKLLGDGCIRVVGGVAVETPNAKPRWNGQKKAG